MIIKKLFEYVVEIDEYLKRLKNKFGNKYDYSNIDIVYKNNRKYVNNIYCLIHHVKFDTRADNFSGCPECSGRNKKIEDIIKKAKDIHGDKYDYSNIDIKTKKDKNGFFRTYINNIYCPKHKYFNIRLDSHLDKSKPQGCKKCAFNIDSKEEFIKKAKDIHGDKYDYSLVDYKGVDYNVDIICKKHVQSFSQKVYTHLKGSGCPICQESKGERKVANFLDFYNIEYIRQHKFPDLKNKLLLPFDFYLPKMNICVEYDGVQHFKPISHFGGEITFEKCKKNDKLKNEYCISNNIPLLRLTYKDSDSDVKSKILNFLQIKESRFITKFFEFI